MIKRILFVTSLLFFCLTAAYAADTKVRVISKKAEIKLEPSLQSEVITAVPLGAVLSVTKKEGEWYVVELPNEKGFKVTGYIHQNAVNLIEETNQEFRAKEVEPKIETKPKPQEPFEQEETTKGKSKGALSPETEIGGRKSAQSSKAGDAPAYNERKRLFLWGELGLAFPSGDWSDLFRLGIEATIGNGFSLVRQPMMDIDLLGSFGGALFFRRAGYTDISWTRVALAADLRLSLKPGGGFYIFGQGGAGVYLDIFEVKTYWWWLEEASEFRFGPRFGGGIGYRGLELYLKYHAVEYGMLSAGISVVF